MNKWIKQINQIHINVESEKLIQTTAPQSLGKRSKKTSKMKGINLAKAIIKIRYESNLNKCIHLANDVSSFLHASLLVFTVKLTFLCNH